MIEKGSVTLDAEDYQRRAELMSRTKAIPRDGTVKSRAYEIVDELLKRDLYEVTDQRPFKDPGRKVCLDPRFQLDHLYLDQDGKVTQHPYGLGMQDCRKLIQWCEENGYKFYIDGRSEWFPGWTVKVTFEKESSPQISMTNDMLVLVHVKGETRDEIKRNKKFVMAMIKRIRGVDKERTIMTYGSVLGREFKKEDVSNE